MSHGPAQSSETQTADAGASGQDRTGAAVRSVSLEVRLPRTIEAPREARDVAAQLCRQRRLPASLRPDLLLLVSEVVTNAVTHGDRTRGEPFLLTAVVSEDSVRVMLADSGHGFTAAEAGDADAYGLYLLDRIASHWGVEASGGDGATTVWFELTADRYPYSDARRHRLAM